MVLIKKINISTNSCSKQTGATLFTTLVFLTLMTIVSVSAVKISMVDILIAANDQQQMAIFHETENDLADFVVTQRLKVPLDRQNNNESFGNGGDEVNNGANTYSFPDTPAKTEKIITDLESSYSCFRNGIGSSLGPGAPRCKLYDFQLRKTSPANRSVRDAHHIGAGKMVPNSNSKGSLL